MEKILRDRIATVPVGTNELSEDWVLSPAAPGPLAAFQVDYQAVTLLETPLIVRREMHLFTSSETLRLVLGLCLSGPSAARDYLIRLSTFQREPKVDEIQALDLQPGAVGFCWSWEKDGSSAHAAFSRHNLVASLAGRLSTVRSTARALDDSVRGLKTSPPTPGGTGTSSQRLGTVAPGARLELPVKDTPGTQLFFIGSGGAVNRDPAQTGRYYYRAGLKPGLQKLEAFQVGRGLLPERTSFEIEIG